MIVTKSGIKVISYVHTERGLADCDELGPKEKVKAHTAIKTKLMNELYRGEAVFWAEGEQETGSREQGVLSTQDSVLRQSGAPAAGFEY